MNSSEEYDSLIGNLKKLPREIRTLLEKRIELFSLEIGERIANMVVYAVYRLTGTVLLALGLVLILFAASHLVGKLLDNEWLGFVVVAAPFLLVGLLFFYRRPRAMVNATRDKMLNQFMKDLSEHISRVDTHANEDEDHSSDDKENIEKNERESKKPANG